MMKLTIACLLGSFLGCLSQETTTANLAIGRPTVQSSLNFGGLPERGVDGDNNPSWGGATCTHTDIQDNPWWAVDLGSFYYITTVVVHNREDCCSERLAGITAVASDQLLAEGDAFSTLTSSTPCASDGSADSVVTLHCEAAEGQYVYLYLPSNQYLTMCEVEVFGNAPPAPPANLALGASVWQSSLAYGGDPARGVDGNNDQTYGGGSCTHTDIEANPWWGVDLGETHVITSVVITNRVDCCGDRLGGVTAVASDQLLAAGDDFTTLTDYDVCASGGADSTVTLDCAEAEGRYVYLYLPSTEYLTLCEVEIHGHVPECEDTFTVFDNMHAEGGEGVEGIETVIACLQQCLYYTDDCVGVDYDFRDDPWGGIHCWLHIGNLGGELNWNDHTSHYESAFCE